MITSLPDFHIPRHLLLTLAMSAPAFQIQTRLFTHLPPHDTFTFCFLLNFNSLLHVIMIKFNFNFLILIRNSLNGPSPCDTFMTSLCSVRYCLFASSSWKLLDKPHHQLPISSSLLVPQPCSYFDHSTVHPTPARPHLEPHFGSLPLRVLLWRSIYFLCLFPQFTSLPHPTLPPTYIPRPTAILNSTLPSQDLIFILPENHPGTVPRVQRMRLHLYLP